MPSAIANRTCPGHSISPPDTNDDHRPSEYSRTSEDSAMIDLITDNRVQIAELCRIYGVQKLEVFGSAATEAFDPDRSDIDLIVDFADESPGLARRYVASPKRSKRSSSGESISSSTNRSRTRISARASTGQGRPSMHERTAKRLHDSVIMVIPS